MAGRPKIRDASSAEAEKDIRFGLRDREGFGGVKLGGISRVGTGAGETPTCGIT